MRLFSLCILTCALWSSAPSADAADRCLAGAAAVSDAQAIAAIRGTVNAQCPCASFDGSVPTLGHGAYVKCARAIVRDAADGTPLANGYALRRQCKGTVATLLARSTCGYPPSDDRIACCEHAVSSGKDTASIQRASRCVDSSFTLRTRCAATPFASDACSGDATNSCRQKVVQTTVDVPSTAQPANTPGSPGVPPSADPRFIAQFGSASFSLNNARYTRYRLAGPIIQPDGILVVVPGFEGGAGDFKILAENLIVKAQAAGTIVELWAIDRRTNQLEDTAGLDVAEDYLDPLVAVDWLFGGEMSLPLRPVLAGLNRRANFYNTNSDTAFMASWTNLMFSQDIDDVVQAARAVARNANVFLGGHSAGTGFAARYAATDFDLGAGTDPGYARVRGLVLLEGGGASTGTTPSADSLDRMIAKFDGGLYGAVRDNAPRCVDGTTACTIDTEGTDCAGQTPPKCTLAAASYSIVAGLLNPRVLSTGEIAGLQSATDPDGGQLVLQVDQGAPGNSAITRVPELSTLGLLPRSTALGGLGNFIDDDGVVASLATFVSSSVGGPGPVIAGIQHWQDISEGPLPAALVPNNGPAPTTLPGTIWGVEREPSKIQRVADTNYVGRTNFTDWYYPSAGPSTTSASGRCVSSVCTAGAVGASCSSDAQCAQSFGLDSTALSVGRNRPDIENLTQAANINIPVIGFGGSNGLTPVPGRYVPFANSIGVCTAPSCDGTTARVVSASTPNPAFPTLGDINGGFEVYISEGYAHVDVTTAEDDASNNVLGPLLSFLQRNLQ